MPSHESRRAMPRLTGMLAIIGLLLLAVGLFVDPAAILKAIGFPLSKLGGERGQADLALLRVLTVVAGAWLMGSQMVIWKDPDAVAKAIAAAKRFVDAAVRLPSFTALFLAALVLVKTGLQLGLYLAGYRAYAGDDFARSWKAYEWLQHQGSKFDLAAWLNIGDPYLPFPDYLFGLGLALYDDVYITPKIMNLLLSGIAVIAAYFLGRQLFGRAAGLLTAALCAFQPWVVWLGISGMTSDIFSVIMITLFGYFLVRWLDNRDTASVLLAAGCLFIAAGIRYENWFFIVIFSLALAWQGLSMLRAGEMTPKWAAGICAALIIANAFPVFHMAVSYYLTGELVPAMHHTDSFRGPAIPKINMALLALSAYPMELAVAGAGIALLLLRTERRRQPIMYLAIVALAFFAFAAAFRGRLPIHGAGPERNLLTYIMLLLPCAGYFLARLFRSPRLDYPAYAVLAASVVLTLATFDVTRAFNYPAKKFDQEAFAAGWTLRMLQGLQELPDDARVAIERGEQWVPFPIIVLANRPERFALLDEGDLGGACNGAFNDRACQMRLFDGSFDMIILRSPEKVQVVKDKVNGRSWQFGRWHLFELIPAAEDGKASPAPAEAAQSQIPNQGVN